MKKTLGGAVFIRNAMQHDYHILETIDCLLEMCDKVVVLDAGSVDGTLSRIMGHMEKKLKDFGLVVKNDDFTYSVSGHEGQQATLIVLRPQDWREIGEKDKSAYFQNIALSELKTDYVFLLQGDEIVHEDSFEWIRQAMDNDVEGVLCRRINLWGHPDYMLDVSEGRMPCIDVVVRLAKRGYLSYDDGDNIAFDNIDDSYVDNITIMHYGYVKNREVMAEKIKHIQKSEFGVLSDPKLKDMDTFNPFAWFSKQDLKRITITHPKFITEWVEKRKLDYFELW